MGRTVIDLNEGSTQIKNLYPFRRVLYLARVLPKFKNISLNRSQVIVHHTHLGPIGQFQFGPIRSNSKNGCCARKHNSQKNGQGFSRYFFGFTSSYFHRLFRTW